MSVKKILSHKSTEGTILKYGCLLLFLEIIFYVVLLIYNPGLFKKLIAVIAAVIVGGRFPAITIGLELGLNQFTIILFLFIYNLIVLLVCYPLIVMFCENVIETRFLKNILNSTKKKAEVHKDKIMKFGSTGLFLFVWFPFPWSGVIVGSTIGFLMGLSTGNIMVIVIPSMFVGIVSWAIGFQYLRILTGLAGKITSISLVVLILAVSLILRFRKSSKAGNR